MGQILLPLILQVFLKRSIFLAPCSFYVKKHLDYNYCEFSTEESLTKPMVWKNRKIPITIKENLLTYSRMFSEQTAPIGTYDIPMDSDLHGEGPWKIWGPGIDRVFSSITIKDNTLITVPVFSETTGPICKVGIPIESSWQGQQHDVLIFASLCRELPGQGF